VSLSACCLDPILLFPYHVFVATRRANRKSKGSQAIVIFWLVFIIVIISVFMGNAETIQRNFNLFKTRLTTSPGVEEELLMMMEEEEPVVTVIIEQPRPSVPEPQPAPEPVTPVQTPQPAPVRERPAAQPQVQPAVQTRERVIYYTQISSDGQILQSRVTRRVPVSESPMVDALNVLLTGPSADELGRGVINLIPQNTRVISATVRGNTAYINFNEDFLFNTFGVEGYVAQLRQIVWTVTEFQNIRDVQILIEGRRLDYLGEGIWIGSPISRQSF
jgi:hypothetical protein